MAGAANPGFSTLYVALSARGMAGAANPGFSTLYAALSARGMEQCLVVALRRGGTIAGDEGLQHARSGTPGIGAT